MFLLTLYTFDGLNMEHCKDVNVSSGEAYNALIRQPDGTMLDPHGNTSDAPVSPPKVSGTLVLTGTPAQLWTAYNAVVAKVGVRGLLVCQNYTGTQYEANARLRQATARTPEHFDTLRVLEVIVNFDLVEDFSLVV